MSTRISPKIPKSRPASTSIAENIVATQLDAARYGNAKTPEKNTTSKEGPPVTFITVRPSTVVQPPEDIIKRDETLRVKTNGRKVAVNVLREMGMHHPAKYVNRLKAKDIDAITNFMVACDWNNLPYKWEPPPDHRLHEPLAQGLLC